MVAYELIQELESLPYFNDLLKKGLVPVNWLDYKVIYEFYVDKLKELQREGLPKRKASRTAKTITSDEFGIGESSVYQIIRKMKG